MCLIVLIVELTSRHTLLVRTHGINKVYLAIRIPLLLSLLRIIGVKYLMTMCIMDNLIILFPKMMNMECINGSVGMELK